VLRPQSVGQTFSIQPLGFKAFSFTNLRLRPNQARDTVQRL